MSTSKNNVALEASLGQIPSRFRKHIIKEYTNLKRRFIEASYDNQYDVPGLSAGKFVEAVLRFLQHELTGTYTPFGVHISNLPGECRKLIASQSTKPESLRVIIPRALVFIFTLRGKRGIGHLAGDIEANHVDATTIIHNADWIVCELIRIFHKLSLEEAQSIVDALTSRNLPDVWEVDGKKRVLRNDLSLKDRVLLLLYSEIQSSLLVEDLFGWSKASSMQDFKKRILKELDKINYVEFSKEDDIVYLSPTGEAYVEENILQLNTHAISKRTK